MYMQYDVTRRFNVFLISVQFCLKYAACNNLLRLALYLSNLFLYVFYEM